MVYPERLPDQDPSTKLQAASVKQQATSFKHPGASFKRQAPKVSSHKQQASSVEWGVGVMVPEVTSS
jgi:hypothetical protein